MRSRARGRAGDRALSPREKNMTRFFLFILLTLCFIQQDESKLPKDFKTLQEVSVEELRLKT